MSSIEQTPRHHEAENDSKLLLMGKDIHNMIQPAFIIYAKNFNFYDVNKSAIEWYGYSKEEFGYLNAFDLLTPSELEKVKNDVDLFRGEFLYTSISKHHKKNGDDVTVCVVAKHIRINNRDAWQVKIIEKKSKN